jgi:hypothetical protein
MLSRPVLTYFLLKINCQKGVDPLKHGFKCILYERATAICQSRHITNDHTKLTT